MLIRALIWLLLLIGDVSAQGFIATPSPLTLIGYASVTNGNTAVVRVANAVPTNALIIVGSAETSLFAGAVTDSNANSYSTVYHIGFGGGTGQTEISFATANAILSVGATITFTTGQTTKNANVAAYYAVGYTTIDPISPNSASGTSTTPIVTTLAPTQANELFVSAIGGPTTIASFTQDTNWSALPKEVSLTAPMLAMAAFVNTTANAMTYAPILGTSVRWGIVALSFH